MTLPASGTLSMSQVNTELSRGSSAQISLGESAVRSLAGVASGVIAFQNLRGKPAVAITLEAASPSSTGSYAEYVLNASGSVVYTGQSGSENWLTPQSGMSDYEVQASALIGSPTGTFNTWLNLGTTRIWGLISPSGSRFAEVQLKIRRVNTSTILDTAGISFSAGTP